MYDVILVEVTKIKERSPTQDGIWFLTESPGEMPPALIYLSWADLASLYKLQPPEKML